MESLMPVNEMLIDNISKLNCSLIPPGFHGDVRSVRMMVESLCKVIDAIGAQSAKAQGLNKVITTAEKLRNSPTHILYLLKDATAKQGKGELIGLLKIGRKHLFLFDDNDKVREVEPLCVLDFFIVPERQRHGLGRILFDYMLEDMEVAANELAIDGPSPKMERFMTKNYRIERLIRQSNNFAIASTFFEAVDAAKILTSTQNRNSNADQESAVVAAAVGRYAAPKPVSAIAHVIHGAHFEDPNHGEAEDNSVADAEVDKAVEPRPKTDEAREINDGSIRDENTENQKSPERPSTLKVGPVNSCDPALLRSCDPGNLGADNPVMGNRAVLGNPAGLGFGNPAGLGLGNLAGLGLGNRAGLGLGNRPGFELGNPGGFGFGNRAGLGLGNRAGFGLGNPAGRWTSNLAMGESGYQAVFGSGYSAGFGLVNPARLALGNPPRLGSGKPAGLGSSNPAGLGMGNPSVLGAGNSAGRGSGGPAVFGAGNSVAHGSGGPAVLEAGNSTGLGSGRPAGLGLGNSVGLGLGRPAVLGAGNSAGLGSGSPGVLGVGNSAGLGSPGPAVLGVGNSSGLGLGGPAVLGVGNSSGLGSGGPAVLGVGNSAGLGSVGPAVLGVGNSAGLGSGNPAVLGAGNSADLGSNNTEVLESGDAEQSPAQSPAGSIACRRDSQLTDRGYFDVKFYHNKLW